MTKNVTIIRQPSTDEGTFGSIHFGVSSVCTTELPWRNNAKRVSCIPSGTYEAIWARSPKFGMCYHLLDVPDRADILIHPANFGGDETFGWQTELLGCIAPALSIMKMKNKHGVDQLAGSSSRKALAIFQDWADEENLRIEIRQV